MGSLCWIRFYEDGQAQDPAAARQLSDTSRRALAGRHRDVAPKQDIRVGRLWKGKSLSMETMKFLDILDKGSGLLLRSIAQIQRSRLRQRLRNSGRTSLPPRQNRDSGCLQLQRLA